MDRLSSGVALAAYAEPLLEGKRVVVFGDATNSVAAELLERGARGVHVYDPDPTRAALAAGKNRSKQISIVPLDDADIAVRDGAFDVAIVEDLSLAKEPVALMKRVRRALGARGTAIVASPNAEAKLSLVPRTSAGAGTTPLGYYELYDTVSAEFAEVRMLGQTPFLGYAIVDFAPDGEPEVSIDTELVPGGAEEPEWFVAVASREPVACDPFGIVQLPAADVFAARDDGALASDVRAARASESTLVARVALLEAELAEARARPSVIQAPSNTNLVSVENRERQAALEASLATATAEKKRLEEQVRTLTAERERANQASTATLSAEKKPLEEQIGTLTAERERANKLLGTVQAERDAHKASLAKAVAEKGVLEDKLAERDAQIQRLVGAEGPSPTDEVGLLEDRLKERASRILKLESDLREAERIGKELVRQLSQAPSEAAETASAEPLAARNARLIADLEAASWTIQELEDRLSHTAPAAR